MEAIVDPANKDLVHHMEIFHCQHSQATPFDGECSSSMRPRESKSCSRVIAAWAMGEGVGTSREGKREREREREREAERENEREEIETEAERERERVSRL